MPTKDAIETREPPGPVLFTWNSSVCSVGSMSSGREGDTESETGSRLLAVSTEPDVGLELTDREIMTGAKVGHLTD